MSVLAVTCTSKFAVSSATYRSLVEFLKIDGEAGSSKTNSKNLVLSRYRFGYICSLQARLLLQKDSKNWCSNQLHR